MRMLFICSLAVLLLAGCKAEEIEISVDVEDVFAVAAGGEGSAEFEAVFSNFGELDEEQRSQVEALETILEDFVEIDDFEIEITDMGFDVTIEGRIPMSSNPDEQSAYFLSVTESDSLSGFLRVEVQAGPSFETMETRMKGINFMLAPDRYHPTQLRLRGEGVRLLAPAVQVEGKAHLLLDTQLDGRLNLNFKGGPYDNTGAGVFLSEN